MFKKNYLEIGRFNSLQGFKKPFENKKARKGEVLTYILLFFRCFSKKIIQQYSHDENYSYPTIKVNVFHINHNCTSSYNKVYLLRSKSILYFIPIPLLNPHLLYESTASLKYIEHTPSLQVFSYTLSAYIDSAQHIHEVPYQ